jgi:hypothetical protein
LATLHHIIGGRFQARGVVRAGVAGIEQVV